MGNLTLLHPVTILGHPVGDHLQRSEDKGKLPAGSPFPLEEAAGTEIKTHITS